MYTLSRNCSALMMNTFIKSCSHINMICLCITNIKWNKQSANTTIKLLLDPYAASGATPKIPDRSFSSLQRRTSLIKQHVLSINLSNDVNFMREKSSRQAGMGAKGTAGSEGLASTTGLPLNISRKTSFHRPINTRKNLIY